MSKTKNRTKYLQVDTLNGRQAKSLVFYDILPNQSHSFDSHT